jgi:hypothetical protein
MEKTTIRVIGVGINGSTICSIIDSTGQKIITNKGIGIIAEEIYRTYPEIAEQIALKSESFDVDSINSIDISKLQPTAKHKLISKIVEICRQNK